MNSKDNDVLTFTENECMSMLEKQRVDAWDSLAPKNARLHCLLFGLETGKWVHVSFLQGKPFLWV